MLEFRLTADAKRIAAMRAAIARACRRETSDPAHADMVALVSARLAEQPAGARDRRADVLVVVNVHSDVTTVMVRLNGIKETEMGESRRRVLEGHATRWSTISGRDGRTIVAEIPRAPAAREAVPLRLDPLAQGSR